MAKITAAMVKELRERSGAGMMDCKKALSQADGDMDQAVEILRENGKAKADKKQSRIAAEGLTMVVSDSDDTAAIVEVNSETDFVARNEKFQEYVANVAKQALHSDAKDMDSFMAEKWVADESMTVKEALVEETSIISEKLSIRRFAKVHAENGFVTTYVHAGGRIGVIVEAETTDRSDAAKEAMKNVALQIASMRPMCVNESELSQDYINHEKEVLTAQIENDPKESQKPDKVKAGIVTGRLKKELKEVCLNDQVYVKAEDGKQSVAKYLEQVSKEIGTPISVKSFVRYETGEGIEKREENFAEEVAKQMKQ